MENFLQIQQLARITDVPGDTIRYYEKIGLIEPPQRGTNGYRLFAQSAVGKLQFIKACRNVGLSIDDIRQLDTLQQNPYQDCHDADKIVARHLAEVKAKIAQLQEIQAFLENISRHEHGEIAKCKVLNGLKGE